MKYKTTNIMNREILFRGLKADGSNEWVYGYYVYDSLFKCDSINQGDGNWHTVIPSTVGQWTGLTDKNGTHIFEGDLLDENGYLFTVVYSLKWAKFMLQHCSKAIQYPEWNRGVLMEVIGNIHQE